jgi:exonuclease 3'-5' domain-containing protein 2
MILFQGFVNGKVNYFRWYIEKDLGILIQEDPLRVRLKFEPSGRPEGPAGEYYLTVKDNICVVCGQTESYLRKYIVPHEYRKFFPEVMRDHQSHDVLLMCTNCHQVNGQI